MDKEKHRRVPIATTLRPQEAARLRALAQQRGVTVSQLIRKPVLAFLRRARWKETP